MKNVERVFLFPHIHGRNPYTLDIRNEVNPHGGDSYFPGQLPRLRRMAPPNTVLCRGCDARKRFPVIRQFHRVRLSSWQESSAVGKASPPLFPTGSG